MLGRRSPQTSFADTDEWYKRIPARSVWAQVRAGTTAHIHDADYADGYQETGRPSIPPSFVMPLLLLPLRQGWSDREAVEAACYDDRVKFARGWSRSPEIQMERSTLCKYRGRVLATDTDQALRRATLTAAEGLPAPALQRTDDAERRRPAIAWADPAARAALRQVLGADSATCQAWYTGARAGTESLQQAVALLATVTTPDTEPDPNRGVRLA